MKILSNFLLGAYFLVSGITFLLLILDLFRDLHFVPDDIFFFILRPATILLGIFGGFHSRQMLLIKLIPWAFTLCVAFLLGNPFFIIVGICIVLVLAAIQSSFAGLLTHWYVKKYGAQVV